MNCAWSSLRCVILWTGESQGSVFFTIIDISILLMHRSRQQFESMLAHDESHPYTTRNRTFDQLEAMKNWFVHCLSTVFLYTNSQAKLGR